jgi:cell division protein FtsQ
LGLAAVVFFTPVCAVRQSEIEVLGVEGVVSEAAVTRALTPVVGTPLARLDLGSLRGRIGEIRGVKNADVRREWPTGLLVTIEARRPAACVQREGGGWTVLDRDAVQIADVAQAPKGLPEVVVPLDDSNRRTLRAVLDVLDSIPKALRSQIAEVGAESRDTVHFILDSGARVDWGDSGEPELKAATLQVLMKTPAAQYNVSAPTMPFLRQASEEQASEEGEGPGEDGGDGSGEDPAEPPAEEAG